MNANRVLYERISEVLDRPAYKKEVMYNSKAVAAKASLSPVNLTQTLKTEEVSLYDADTKQLISPHLDEIE